MEQEGNHCKRLFLSLIVALATSLLPQSGECFQRLEKKASPNQATRQIENTDDPLGRLLVRLDLNQLRTAHVEKILASDPTEDAKRQLQTTLAKLYVAQLKDFIEDQAEFSRVSKRLEELEITVPELATPESLFQRFETSFQHGEYLLTKFREDRRREDDLTNAGIVFRDLAEKFEALRQTSDDRIEVLDEIDENDKSRISDIEVDRELDLLSNVSFKASFYAGWSFFNAGISTGDARLGQSHFRRALISFCRFLDIDPADKPADWDAIFLELNLARNSQAFLGVALSYLAIGQNSDADDCFALLAGEGSSEEIKSQIAFWQIQSLLEFGKVGDAALFANSYLSPDGGLEPIQQGQLALLVIRFAYAKSDRDDKINNLGLLGFKTLAKLRQFQLTTKLIDDYRVVLPRPSFYSDWLTGQYHYAKAEKSGDAAGYQMAADQLKLAVQQETGVPIADVERCRNRLGWAYYKAGDFQKAGDCFAMVFSRIARLDPGLAASAAWLQHDCCLKQSDSIPGQIDRALKILEDLVSRFPESELAPKARLQIVKLRQTSLDPDDAIERLKDVVSNSPKDNVAKYELIIACYRSFLLKAKNGESTIDAKQVLDDSLEEIEAVLKELSNTQRLKILLIKIDLAERNGEPESKLQTLFSNAFSLASNVESSSLKAELHFRAYQREKLRNNEAEMNRHMDWLIRNGDGSNYQAAVLVNRATQIESDLKNAVSDVERNELYSEAVEIYKKLVNVNGVNVTSIQSNNNARVAVSRLAQLMETTGKNREALGYLEILVAAVPTNAGYLRRYGSLLVSEEQYLKAVEVWRKLAAGLKKDSEPWYEAKYFVFKCLVESTPDQATEPFQQFMALYPNPPEKWKRKFIQLQVDLGSKGSNR